MMRPQLGSLPASAVLTSGELAIARATRSASAAVFAPRTSTATSFDAPSPSLTISLASVWQSSTSPAANHEALLAPARTVTPEAPLASASTVSLVDVSPSTVMWLKDSFTAAHSTSRKTVGATAASVVMKASMVAMRGWIIPAPLATPARQTDRTPASVRNTQDFENVSVVLMARGTSSAFSMDRFRTRTGS